MDMTPQASIHNMDTRPNRNRHIKARIKLQHAMGSSRLYVQLKLAAVMAHKVAKSQGTF